MPDKHAYIPTPSYLVQTINHFRKSLPAKVTADTLKKLGFAPQQESYVLNILRSLGLIDQEGTKTELASKTFSQHDDSTFSKGFSKLVEKAYADLFEIRGKDAWSLETDALITFFRQSDQTTATVGKLQASTFQRLAAFSGHGEIPAPRRRGSMVSTNRIQKKPYRSKAKDSLVTGHISSSGIQADSDKRMSNIGLTVRIEINLPSDGDQETYNRIFKSIRENLLNE